jgi:large subunit ribosomal protein L35Ae|tara:strand:- start:39422 stop:39679 length:258 start_codon:yes stop_codon:yes gene_type:complete
MQGTIVHFRGSRRVKRTNQMVLQVSGVDNKDKASKLIGKKVVWKSPAGKQLNGEITNIHGNSGALRVRFDTGMPGQSIGAKVAVE